MTLHRLLLFAYASATLGAQQAIPPDEMQLSSSAYWPRSQSTLKVEARLVEVQAVVRDSRGHPIGGLVREDFEIEDAGKKRAITAFSAHISTPPVTVASARDKPATAAQAVGGAAAPKGSPRFLALVFDDINMGPSDLIPARIAAKRFLKQGFAGTDMAGIFSTSKGQIEPFTADAAKLSGALDHLTIAARNPDLLSCPNFTTYEAYMVANHPDSTILPSKIDEAEHCGFCPTPDRRHPRDPSCPQRVKMLGATIWEQTRETSARTFGVIAGIVDYMAKMPGKRILLLTSPGFLSDTLERDRDAIVEHALHSEVVINSLDAKGLYTQDLDLDRSGVNAQSTIVRQSIGTRGEWAANDSMAILAASTGGLFFENNNDLELGFRELGLTPEFSYSLGFTPDGAADNKYHNLKVRLKPPANYRVQARPGYYSSKTKIDPAEDRQIDKEVMGAAISQDAPARFTALPIKTQAGETALRVVLHLDIPHLQFANQAGVRHQRVNVVAALFDQAGNFVVGKEGVAEFALKEDTFARLTDGLDNGLTLLAQPGKYRLRTVVQEAVGGKIATSTEPIEIR